MKAPLKREHLSVIGALGIDGSLYTQSREGAYNGEAIVEFLKYMVKQVKSKIMIVWDGAIIHRCNVVKEFLGTPDGKQVHLVRLPAYAPELNPIEGVWKLAKYDELKNRCCLDLDDLTQELREAFKHIRKRKRALLGCILQTHTYS